jgi:hypothetical protein
MTGSADDTVDRAALAWLKLEHELKSARMAELAGKSDAPASAEEVRLEPRDYTRLLKAKYKKTFNRDRPLPAAATSPVPGTITNAVAPVVRRETLKGAEAQVARELPKAAAKTTNTLARAADPRSATRPASLPVLAADEEFLAQMEPELHAQIEVTPDDLRALMQARAQSVQRALLKTEKVAAERLFILAPASIDAASRDHSRVNLSLN